MNARLPLRLFLPVCIAALLLMPTPRAEAALVDGLTSHWTFDDNFANVAQNARHGVPIADAHITGTVGDYQFGGGALSVDGTDDYVDVVGQVFPDNPDVFTVSAWVKRLGTSGDQIVWTTSPSYASELSMRLTTATYSRPYWFHEGVENYVDPMQAPHGTWHHYAVTWNRSTGHFKHYIDGGADSGGITHESTADNSGDTFPATTGFHIGADRNTGRKFNGFIDDVAVWNRVLSDAEIAQVYDDPIPVSAFPTAPIGPNGMLAEYTFENKAGTPVSDGLSATGQVDETTGLLHAQGSAPLIGISYSTDVPGDIAGTSTYSLDISVPESHGKHVLIPITTGDSLSNVTLGDFRIDTWFKTTDTGRAVLAGSYAPGASAVNLELHTSNRGRLYIQTGTITDLNVTLPTNSRDGNWHHLVGERTGGTVNMYYDGGLVGTKADTSGSLAVNRDFHLGRDNRTDSGADFAGGLDDIRIYGAGNALLAEYTFETDGGSGVSAGMGAATVDDTSGLVPAHDGDAIYAAPTPPNYRADAPGVVTTSTHSLELDESGIAEYAEIAMTPELAAITQGDFAVETWFKTTDAGRGILVGSLATGKDAVNLEVHEGNDVRIYLDGPDPAGDPTGITDLRANAPAGIDTRDGQWHHLLGQRDGDQVTVWLDGLLAGSRTDLSGAYTMNGDAMYLGRDSRTDTTRFDGNLDNTRIWSRALTEAEIQSLATGATPVPEPGSIILLVLGALGLTVCGVRRRR